MSNPKTLADDEHSPAAEMAIAGIREMTMEDSPSLPALVFVEHILQPLINNERQLVITNWLRCAGNLQRPIRVVDEREQLIGVAPGLLVGAETQLTRNGQSSDSGVASLGDVLDMYQRKAGISPVMAQVYLQDRWNERNFRQNNPYHLLLQWNDLAAKLGCPPPFKHVTRVEGAFEEPTEPTSKSKATFSDDFDE